MSIPAKIFSMGDMNIPVVAQARYREARELYEKERFFESIQVLKDGLDRVENQSAHAGVDSFGLELCGHA